MHFEFLVEGQCELTALSTILDQIVGEYNNPHTWKIHKHRGIGKFPADLMAKPNPADQSLLHNLPARLRAYGATQDKDLLVVVLVDLDHRNSCKELKKDLLNVLNTCPQKPNCLFRIAIEELEAWFLGDQEAIIRAYPNVNINILKNYIQDSQCGTWELLMDAISPGFRSNMKGSHSQLILGKKVEFAKRISLHMNVENNQSPSFKCFRDGIRKHIFCFN